AIGTLPNIPNALLEFTKHAFAVKLLPFFVKVDTLEVAGARNLALPHAADENVVLPVGKFVAGVKCHAGNGDGGYPEYQRRCHALTPRILRHARSKIEPAEAYNGPTVVLTRLQNVNLIAAVGSVFAFPDRAGVGLDRESQRIAMAQRIDLRPI